MRKKRVWVRVVDAVSGISVSFQWGYAFAGVCRGAKKLTESDIKVDRNWTRTDMELTETDIEMTRSDMEMTRGRMKDER